MGVWGGRNKWKKMSLMIVLVFCMDFIRFPTSKMCSAIRDYFTSSLPIWMPFTSFPCLIVLARDPKTKLNKKAIIIVLSLSKVVYMQSFLLECCINCGIWWTSYIKFQKFSSILIFLKAFVMKRDGFIKYFHNLC